MSIFSLAELNAHLNSLIGIEQKGNKTIKVKKIVLKDVTFNINPRTQAIPYNQAIIDHELKLFENQKRKNQKAFFVRDDQLDELKDIFFIQEKILI